MTRSDDNAINIPIDSCSIDLNEYNKSDPPMNYDFDFIASELENSFVFIDVVECADDLFLNFYFINQITTPIACM